MRTIPRDLFNQANLLENMGKLYIALEKYNLQDSIEDYDWEKDSFEMVIDEDNARAHIQGVCLLTEHGEYSLYRNINARERYSIFIEGDDYETCDVFTEEGEISEEILSLLGYKAPTPLNNLETSLELLSKLSPFYIISLNVFAFDQSTKEGELVAFFGMSPVTSRCRFIGTSQSKDKLLEEHSNLEGLDILTAEEVLSMTGTIMEMNGISRDTGDESPTERCVALLGEDLLGGVKR